jgi:predicted nucleotidyltransferase
MKAEDIFKELNPEIQQCTSFICLTGSRNYHLEDRNSDYDFKLLVYPNFTDLYIGANKNNSDTKINGNDIKTTDIRLFQSILEKSNINFLEVLFSDDIFIPTNSNKELDKYNKSMIEELITHREEFAAMNIPRLIKSTKRIVESKITQFNNGNYKAASQAFKELIMLRRYLDNLSHKEKDPFLNAIKFPYNEDDAMKNLYFDIKDQNINNHGISELIGIAKFYLNKIIEKGEFDKKEKDKNAFEKLGVILQNSVAKRIQVELNDSL